MTPEEASAAATGGAPGAGGGKFSSSSWARFFFLLLHLSVYTAFRPIFRSDRLSYIRIPAERETARKAYVGGWEDIVDVRSGCLFG